LEKATSHSNIASTGRAENIANIFVNLSIDKMCQMTKIVVQCIRITMKYRQENVVEQLRESIRSCTRSEYMVAKRAGVDPSVLSRFLRRERGISFVTAAKLCAGMGLKLERAAERKSEFRLRPKPK
jgi:hypothetical protein